ncbi:lysine--tRNA ligase [Pseudoclavibacter soli]|uniref:lysine--tRNA ligase n=1 Tax=Pseudoclavibacter soli TaxID=452623 RepID=UPI0004100931|nr:lysine--tRNA ligase [Pseudoclavibacter soli]
MSDATAELSAEQQLAADTNEQREVRLAKRDRLIAEGEAYPVSVPVTTTIAAVRAAHPDLEAGAETDDEVGIAGRVVHVRNTGKLCFAAIQAGDGTRIQIMVSLAAVGETSLKRFKELVDLGDHLFVHGRVIASKRGELSVFVDQWQIASKAIRPLPNLHSELGEEFRVRNRYLDLIARQQARQMVITRAATNASLRSTFAAHGFTEIETPMLQTVHGGASARPFTTHSNAFDTELFLRIAPELFLKRALVGGIDRVFEINRNFRNEGADSTHSPEFAMLEAYEAYGDYNSIADLTQELIQNAARAASPDGSQTVTWADGTRYDFSGQWDRIDLYGSLNEQLAAAYTGEGQAPQITVETPIDQLQALADAVDLKLDPKTATHGKYVEELWEHYVKPGLERPTFVMDFPLDTSPLTRQHRSKPGVVEKWDLYVRGFELATGYSELADPVVQRQRFVEQSLLAAKGDPEAMQVDEEFLAAMEYGMPPAGGMGMGIDRLLMALTGLGIRETVLFPLVK